MAKIVFEQIIDFITAATPSTGYLIGYDLDGVLKQKDRFGVITPIGASVVSIPPSNPLDIVLLNGNDSGSSDIIMGTSTSIVSSRGSGRLELDNSSDVVLLSTDNSDVLLNIGSVSISNVNGLTSSSIIVSETTEINVSNSTYSSKIEQSINDFNISFTNDSLPGIKDSKVIESGENWIAGNDNRTYLHLNTKDSVTNPNIRNSVIIGGVGLTASSNETAYFKNSETQGGLSKYSVDPSSLVGYDNLTMITKGILDTGTSSIYNYIDTEILPFIGNGLYESGTGTDSIESVHSGNASGDYSVVSGGLNNISSGVGSFIGSGFSNTSSGYQSSIVGGLNNSIDNTSGYSSIVSGYANIISGTSSYSSIGGGVLNTISESSIVSFIGGGDNNRISETSNNSTIGGGTGNIISNNSSRSTISGGQSNTISTGSDTSTISGGYGNNISEVSCYSLIGGGQFNTITENSNYSTISGGYSNTISGTSSHSSLGSGQYNTISNYSANSNINSGVYNIISTNSGYSIIGSGQNNTIYGTSSYSSIIGGSSNEIINSPQTTISGGVYNKVLNNSSTSVISGGSCNTISGTSSYSSIVGGSNNTISGYSSYSSIVGGDNNTISGTSSYSSILGGSNSSINSDNTFVLGSNITANTSNFTYVNNLNIVDTPTTNNSNNNVVVRNSSTGELEINDSLLSLITTGVRFQGDYNATTNTPDLDTTPISGIVKGDMYVVSVSNSDQFFTVEVEVGDMLISKVDSPTLESDWTVVQANLTPSSIKIQYESNSNTNAYTDSEKTKVGHITVTQAVDLDTMESDIATNNLKVSNVTTNLSVGNKTSTTLDVLSSDGTDTTIPSATITEAGLLSASDKVKLDGSTSGNGTINYLTKWTTTGTTLGNSIIRDDGSTIGINTSPSSVTKINILSDKEEGFVVSQPYTSTTGNSTGMRVSTYGNNTSIPNFGIKASAQLGLGNVGIGSSTSGVGQGYVSGADIAVMGTAGRTNGDNYGGYFSSGVVNTGVNYGIKSIASNSTSANYSIWLLDGSEGLGKFLKSVTSDGKANWSNISFSDISSSGITEKTSIDNQDILVIEDSDASFVKKTVKRINLIRPVNNTQTSTNSLTPDSDENQQETITALAANLAINTPSGSPTNGQTLIIRIKDDGTARTLTWNAIYRAIGVTIPTTTTISKTLYLGFIYNSTDTKWDCVAVNEEA